MAATGKQIVGPYHHRDEVADLMIATGRCSDEVDKLVDKSVDRLWKTC